MSIRVLEDAPSSEVLNQRFPTTAEHMLDEHQKAMEAILSGEDKRLAVIIGPCSAWPTEGVYEFADRLSEVSETVSDRLMVIMRMYVQKPRTTLGWPGPLTQPDPNAPHNIREGILTCREMMWRVGKQLPMADEMLYTQNADDFDSLITYTAVGARSTEDTEHRHVASGLRSVVGMKNPTSGNIVKGVDSVQAAQHPQHLLLNGKHVETSGNPYAHLILRGGETSSNYGPESLAAAAKQLLDEKRKINNPAIVVDLSHDNSRNGRGKDYTLQPLVAENVMAGIRKGRGEYDLIRGFMAEAHIVGGRQTEKPDPLKYQSITDPCLSWEEAETMLKEIADQLDKSPRFSQEAVV